RPAVPGVRYRLHIDSDRRVVQRKFSLDTIGVQVLPLPVILEAVAVDNLPVLQLKFDQMNVDGMGIFRQILEVPGLSRADPGQLSDSFIEMPSVNEYRHRPAIGFLLVQGEDFWIPDIRGF